MGLDPGWAGIIGAGIGGLAGGGGVLLVDWRRWLRDRSIRWDQDRKEAYVQYLGLGSLVILESFLYWSKRPGAPSVEHLRELLLTLSQPVAEIRRERIAEQESFRTMVEQMATVVQEIDLMASREIYERAREGFEIVKIAVNLADRKDATEADFEAVGADWKEAREAFRLAARRELRIDV